MNTIRHSLASLRSRWCLAAVLALSSIAIPLRSSAQSAAAAPQVIPFQGRLTNQAGVAYTGGQYSIIFNLYTQAIGGSTLWTERHEKVGVVNGMVNVFLGSITSMTAVDFSTVKYLGITVDVDSNPATADPEMVPRQMIIPAFAAKQSERTRTMDVLDSSSGLPVAGQSFGWSSVFGNGNPGTGTIPGAKLTDSSVTVQKMEPSLATGFVPPGSILAFGGENIPAGYLLCDGTNYARTGTYSNLFTAIGTAYGTTSASNFSVPDLRGVFLRGRARGSSADPDRASRGVYNNGGNAGDALGSFQSDAFRSHTHTDAGHAHGSTGSNFVNAGPGGTVGNGGSAITQLGVMSSTATGYAQISNTGGNETRPSNIYVNYIIKY